MKRYFCPVALMVIAVLAVPLSLILGIPALLVNCLPPVIWSLFLLFGHARWEVLRDFRALFLGLLYGILGAATAASFLVWATAIVFATPHMRYPYDSAAGAILLVLFGLLAIGAILFDYFKYGMKPFWPRFVTALATVAPATQLALWGMELFEGILSQFVS